VSLRVIRLSKLASTKNQPGKLPVSRATVWRWVREGHLPPPFKIGAGTTVWDVDQIDAFLAARAQGGAA
jgi:predicted DNA-binding transcriptional regulator AlpA